MAALHSMMLYRWAPHHKATEVQGVQKHAKKRSGEGHMMVLNAAGGRCRGVCRV